MHKFIEFKRKEFEELKNEIQALEDEIEISNNTVKCLIRKINIDRSNFFKTYDIESEIDVNFNSKMRIKLAEP